MQTCTYHKVAVCEDDGDEAEDEGWGGVTDEDDLAGQPDGDPHQALHSAPQVLVHALKILNNNKGIF
jgi:hypothetical protein